MSDARRPLVVIVGPTASGKTGLAIRLAEQYDGEVISADSRAVFKGLDIGTAKPTAHERKTIPHWGIDLVTPDVRFTVADFKKYAKTKIKEIRARGKMPIIAGGTGLYVDAVLFDYQFPTEANPGQRAALEAKSINELRQQCIKNSIKLPENDRNKRHLIASIVRSNRSPQRLAEPIPNTLIVGIATNNSQLQFNIQSRAEEIWRSGVVDEACRAADTYGWENEAMTGNIYPLIHKVVTGDLSQADAIERFVILDRQLAKRQMTWFRRNPYIMWATLEESYHYCTHILTPR